MSEKERLSGEFRRWSFYSRARHRQLIQWQYLDSKGRLWRGVVEHDGQAKRAAEDASGEKIV